MAIYGGYSTMEYLFSKNFNYKSKNNYLGCMPLLAIIASIGNEELMNLIISHNPQQINATIEKSGNYYNFKKILQWFITIIFEML